mmetsp:Transcript_10542/g.43015  ORF Transcript_10542/g.43015 Transcript_10542/m.43015 type:complete len:260 (+) Transcript_10542:1216-1995(+)
MARAEDPRAVLRIPGDEEQAQSQQVHAVDQPVQLAVLQGHACCACRRPHADDGRHACHVQHGPDGGRAGHAKVQPLSPAADPQGHGGRGDGAGWHAVHAPPAGRQRRPLPHLPHVLQRPGPALDVRTPARPRRRPPRPYASPWLPCSRSRRRCRRRHLLLCRGSGPPGPRRHSRRVGGGLCCRLCRRSAAVALRCAGGRRALRLSPPRRRRCDGRAPPGVRRWPEVSLRADVGVGCPRHARARGAALLLLRTRRGHTSV